MRKTVNRFALTDLREKDGQTMAELARRAGMDRSTLHQIENGKRGAGPAVRKRLALALNVRLSSIEAQIIEAPEPAAESVAA
jgi:transcriptional regulator with XRE-family HTH domain